MAEAVMLSAIESLDCWLLKKGDNLEENFEKLYSLIVGMSDLGEEKKEMVHSLLLQLGMEEERERNKEKLYNLLDFNKEKMPSLVTGMANIWADNKGKLYRLLLQVAEGVEIADLWGDNKGVLDNLKLHSLLVEIADLWRNDEGELNKEKLESFLFQMRHKENYSKKKMMCRMSGEVAGLWKDKQPKLNKEKLYTWLANKVDLYEAEYLFGVLLYDSSYFRKAIREGVEGAKTEFRMILDLITDKKLGEESSLRYFISDVVNMAHDARFLIQLKDSDPFALFFEISVHKAREDEIYYKW